MTKRTCKTLIAAVFAALLFAALDVRAVHAEAASTAIERTTQSVAFRNDMRQLWEDHVFYTRMVIISVDGDQKDLSPLVDRLLQNQVDIGTAIKPFYGDAAGAKLTSLLQDHIKTAGELLLAAKAGDAAKTDDAKTRWYANGDVIAAFLTGANPQHWPATATKPLMKMHLDTTMDEALAHLKGDWKADIAAFDIANKHILMMADALSLGIIRQFPDKFKEGAGDPPASPVTVTMTDSAFDPKNVMVSPGTILKWMNSGQRPHTVTVDSANVLQGGPDSGGQFPNGIQPGKTFTWTVPMDAKPGDMWYYHCKFHGSEGDGMSPGRGMAGSITVR